VFRPIFFFLIFDSNADCLSEFIELLAECKICEHPLIDGIYEAVQMAQLGQWHSQM
jgi:hypothetical protein